MAQAMLRLLATPTTRAVRPSSSPSVTALLSSAGDTNNRGLIPSRSAAECFTMWGRMPAARAVRPRIVALLLVCLAAVAVAAPSAMAHAVLLIGQTTPPPDAQLGTAPAQLKLSFNEPIQLLRAQDVSVVDEAGKSIQTGPARISPTDALVIEAPLNRGAPPGTSTVRFRIFSADAHVVDGAYVYGVGGGALGPPFLGGGAGAGPKETGVWAVSARFIEMIGLGGLLGLMVFRWLVWRPAVTRRRDLPPGERRAALLWYRDMYWVAFGVLAVVSMIAEGYVLVVKSASALGTSVGSALTDPNGISRVLADSRFGSLLQLRAALLFGLFALGVWEFLAESSDDEERDPRPAGRPIPTLIMAALGVATITVISYQGHASQAPAHLLSVADDTIHVISVSTWITGLALIAAVMLRLPRVAPEAGPTIAGDTLARFSAVALIVVSVAILTGVLRSIGELSDPAQLWNTAYGRSIIYKILLLCPIAFLAMRNRRVVTALHRVRRPNLPTLRMVRRSVALELTIAIAIVVVASVLVAQVPPRV